MKSLLPATLSCAALALLLGATAQAHNKAAASPPRPAFALEVKNVLNNNDMLFVISQDRYTPDAGREVELNLTTRF